MSNPSVFARLFDGLRGQWIDPQEIRAETWALGGRHMGRVVEGAREELDAPGLPVRRIVLLKAVIRSLQA
jgi:hypothetical protein